MEEQYEMAFDAILEELKNRGNNKSEQGTIFEDFCKMILEKAPLFSDDIANDVLKVTKEYKSKKCDINVFFSTYQSITKQMRSGGERRLLSLLSSWFSHIEKEVILWL